MNLVVLALVAAGLWLWRRRRKTPISVTPPPPLRLVLILLLVELRSGQSVLGALRQVSLALPGHTGLNTVARVATVGGLTVAVSHAPDELRPVVAQLARAQNSGSSLVGVVRRLLEEDLKEERSVRLARTKALPTRLMVPITLLMLPGIVLLVYGPSMVHLYRDLFSSWP